MKLFYERKKTLLVKSWLLTFCRIERGGIKRFWFSVCSVKSSPKLKMNITSQITDQNSSETLEPYHVYDHFNDIILKVFIYFFFVVGLFAYAFLDVVSKYFHLFGLNSGIRYVRHHYFSFCRPLENANTFSIPFPKNRLTSLIFFVENGEPWNRSNIVKTWRLSPPSRPNDDLPFYQSGTLYLVELQC